MSGSKRNCKWGFRITTKKFDFTQHNTSRGLRHRVNEDVVRSMHATQHRPLHEEEQAPATRVDGACLRADSLDASRRFRRPTLNYFGGYSVTVLNIPSCNSLDALDDLKEITGKELREEAGYRAAHPPLKYSEAPRGIRKVDAHRQLQRHPVGARRQGLATCVAPMRAESGGQRSRRMNDLPRQLAQDIVAMNKREISASGRPSLQHRGASAALGTRGQDSSGCGVAFDASRPRQHSSFQANSTVDQGALV